MNSVRPYTYAGRDTLSNYSHYNQFLAHPLGANFREWIGILRYQPHKRISLYTRVIYWKQGFDAVKAENFGSNIFKPFTSRPYDYNVEIGNGYEGNGLNAQFQFSYELAENIFFDALVLRRKINFQNQLIPTDNTTLLSAGIRMNIFKRDYDF
jgi:hypothetical protein